MTDYTFRTEPHEQQRVDFFRTRNEPHWAYLYEMGLGKTKQCLDVAAWLFSQGKIDLLLSVAPNGVHEDWIDIEVPKHVPEWANPLAAVWSSTMKKDRRAALEAVFENFRSTPEHLRIVSMNIEAFGVQDRFYKAKAGKFARALLENFKVMLVVDESSFIKNAGINRTRRLITLGRLAPYRRILNGTPITNGPLDAYAQFKFLAGNGPPLLGPYSLNKRSFDAHYAEWEEQVRRDNGRKYKTLVRYCNLEELTGYIDKCSTRLLKRDCLDLPEKTYGKIRTSMSPKQEALYKEIKDDAIMTLKTGDRVEINNVLTVMLRLQQVLGGFVPTDDDPENTATECIESDYHDLPRFQDFLTKIEQVQSGKVIVFTRFVAEAKMWLDHFGDEAVSYIGKAHYPSPEERQENKRRFQEDDSVRVMVMNKSGARGITLTAATAMFFYSNSFSLDERLQTEDRAHRMGQHNPVNYFDGVVPGTIDEKLILAHREKKKLADIITQDNPVKWL